MLRVSPLALAIAAALPACASAIALDIAQGPDTHLRSDDRLGEGTAAPSCTASHTCAALGTVTTCTITDSAGTITLTALNASDQTGACVARQSFGSETNWHFELQINSVTGTGQYPGAGGVISQDDGDYSTPDPKAYCWYAAGAVRFKYDVGRGGQVGASSPVSLPVKIATEYRASDNQMICGYFSGVDFIQVGAAQTALAFNTGIRGYFGSSYSLDSASTSSLSARVDNTTLSLDPVDPDPPPSGAYSDDYTDPVAGVTVGAQTQVPIANNTALNSAISGGLACGTDYVLASGTYSGDKTFSASCAATAPMRIVGAASFASTVTGTWTTTGARQILTGLNFSGTGAKAIIRGTNNKFLGNRMAGWSNGAALRCDAEIAPGDHCEIAYNDIGPPAAYGAITYQPGCLPEMSDQCVVTQIRRGVQMNTRGHGFSGDVHLGVWMHHNRLHGFPQKPDPSNFYTGDADPLEFGESGYDWTSTFSSQAWIEYNLFEENEQSGQAAADLKLGGVHFRFNTGRDNDNMRFDQRFGSNNVWEGNVNNSGGSTIHGGNNVIVCNEISGEVKLKSGVVPWNYSMANSNANTHAQVFNALLAKNTMGNLIIGHFSNASEQANPTDNTTIIEHSGSIQDSGNGWEETDTTDNSGSMWGEECLTVELTSDDVGPGALSSADADYLEARGF
jgi:hypothetical protein